MKLPKPSLESSMLQFFRQLGIPEEDWNDPALDIRKTPRRISTMLRDELLSSYKPGAYDDLVRRFTTFKSDGQDGMVFEGPISFNSLCGHHLLNFCGEVFVAYIPDTLLVGASKIPRVVHFYSHMLQIQERMARQIADFLYEFSQAKLVIVLVRATHSCVSCRGVKQAGMKMVTTAVRPQPGGPDDASWRGVADEFYAQLALATRS